jgi:hypothetical protein
LMINAGAFHHCSSITCIVIDRTVQVLAKRCFWHCEHLETVILRRNSQVSVIGKQAFCSCSRFVTGVGRALSCHLGNADWGGPGRSLGPPYRIHDDFFLKLRSGRAGMKRGRSELVMKPSM